MISLERFVGALLLGTLFLGGTSCGDASAQDPIDVFAEDLPCASAAGESWESAEWPPFESAECRWMEFDGRRTYRIAHPLGRRPQGIQLFLSFNEDGRDAAPSAGDPTRIIAVNDDTLVLRNGSNQDFFLKVVLQ